MLENKIHKFINQNALVAQGDMILACVSGGVDSMVMLHLLLNLYGERVGVAHCNFGLRPNEADIETELVEQYCAEKNIELYVARFDTKAQALKGESIQMAARRLRYDFFQQTSAEKGYHKIAIAHNFDDKIETFFINLTRGAGLNGLRSISTVSGKVIRPLLDVTRSEILNYASQNKIPFLNDSSNEEDKYLRNKLRHSVVPIMREVSSFDVAMKSAFSNLSSVNEFVEKCVDEKLSDFDLSNADKYLLFRYLERFGFNADVSGQLFDSYKSGILGKRFYSNDYVALVNKGELVVEPLDKQIENIKLSSSVEPFFINKNYASGDEYAFFDADLVVGELNLRLPITGDAFVPFGMKGRKLLSDFFKDSGVNQLERSKKWLLCCADEILWIVGMRTDNQFKVSTETKNVLRVDITKVDH